MDKENKAFYTDYEAKQPEDARPTGSFIDSDREYPVESRCCITGERVKHSYCRYLDASQGTMMVMSHEAMLKFSRKGNSLSEKFEQVLDLRRKHEKHKQKPS